MERSDEELVAAYIRGEEEAFSELTRRHLATVYSFAYRLSGKSHEAEDITQETFLKVWKNLKKYQSSKANFKTWMLRIARNTTIDHLRKKKHPVFSDFDTDEEKNIFEETLVDPEPLAEELFAKVEDEASLAKALANLSPKNREILALHYTNHLTFEEIAQIFDEPANTIKSRHRRSLIALRALLAQQLPAPKTRKKRIL